MKGCKSYFESMIIRKILYQKGKTFYKQRLDVNSQQLNKQGDICTQSKRFCLVKVKLFTITTKLI